jgi:hypothetical protein
MCLILASVSDCIYLSYAWLWFCVLKHAVEYLIVLCFCMMCLSKILMIAALLSIDACTDCMQNSWSSVWLSVWYMSYTTSSCSVIFKCLLLLRQIYVIMRIIYMHCVYVYLVSLSSFIVCLCAVSCISMRFTQSLHDLWLLLQLNFIVCDTEC